MSTLDYPMIRATDRCPLCTGRKPRDTFVCWPCFRLHGFRYGPSSVIKRELDDAETALAAKEGVRS